MIVCVYSLCLSEHTRHAGNASFTISKFSMTLSIIFSNREQKRGSLSVHAQNTRARARARTHVWGISITNDWKNMMTNNDALQGQKYTNGAGAVPQRMMATAADVCSLQMASCTLSAVSSLSARGTPGELSRCGRAGISLSRIPYGACSVYLKAFRLVNKWTTTAIINRFVGY